MNPLDKSWDVLKMKWGEMKDALGNLKQQDRNRELMSQPEEPEAPTEPEAPPAPALQRVGPAEEKYLQQSYMTHVKQTKPHHITWTSPTKAVGWVNGELNYFADQWARENAGTYTEDISETWDNSSPYGKENQ